ncbi:MAG TPA: hypothetical protein VFY65_05940, partial [Longimicrobium sp.]|nr:hypothetical protein [Longimicrobium sp.]
MPTTSFLRLASVASLVAISAAFVPARRDDAPPPDLCALAATLNDAALTGVCGSIRHLGFGTFNELQLIPPSWNVLLAIDDNAEGREELAARRHFFAYDEFVFTVRDDAQTRLDMVLRAAAAIARIRQEHPDAYRFMTAMKVFPTAPSMANTAKKNRYDRIFISFDRTPSAIAAGATLDGLYDDRNGLQYFSNYAIISIDEETILGATAGKGSQLIYGRPSAVDNYRAYMADGFLYSLMHEMTHRYVDYTNSTSRLALAIYSGRGAPGATDAEEVVANETGMSFVEAIMSQEMRRHVMDQNTIMAGNPGVRSRLDDWSKFVSRSRSRL